EVLAELTWPPVALALLEPAGGIRSPMTSDGADTVDLIDAVAPDDVLLVADAGLGTINAVRLCLEALVGSRVTVFLNRFDGGGSPRRTWITSTGSTASPTCSRPTVTASGSCSSTACHSCGRRVGGRANVGTNWPGPICCRRCWGCARSAARASRSSAAATSCA